MVWWWVQGQRIPPKTSSSGLVPGASRLVSELAAQYQAEPQWAQGLSGYTPYSIEVERALVRQDGKPILFVGTVTDVRHREKAVIVEMEADPSDHVPFLRFSLNCSSTVVARLEKEPQRPAHYVAVAHIESVSKARFRMDASGQTIGEDEVETELEIVAGDYFVARGQCVDLQRHP